MFLSDDKTGIKINGKGFSLLEVSLALVFLVIPIVYAWKINWSDSANQYTKQLAKVICQHASALATYIDLSQSSSKKEVNIIALQDRNLLPLGGSDKLGKNTIHLYTNDQGVGLVILSGNNTNDIKMESIQKMIGFYGASIIQDKGSEYIENIGGYFRALKSSFPDIPGNIIGMAIIPPVRTPVHTCPI
ncbi:hypothetical protein GY514_004964 [Escherichia coli]|nr:hypothetical protein [Escherichia coli]EFI3662589.1 hypothetical protein [Escherichia coli]